MVTLTPTRHGSPNTRRRTRPAAPLSTAAGRLIALALVALALATAAAPALAAPAAATATTTEQTATTPATGKAPAKATDKAAADDPENLPIPEGSSGPAASISGGGGGTLLRLGLGLAVVVGLIGLVWYVMKRVQRSRYPALDDRNTGGLIDVLATTPLSPHRSLHLVRVGEEIVLVGSTDHSVAPIARIGAEDAVSLVGATAPDPKSFRGDPGAAARTRAQTTAADSSVVERLRAMTARK